VKRSFPFRTGDGREGVVRPARAGDARASLRIVEEAMRERPRTLSVLEEELWGVRDWRRHTVPWGPNGVTLVAEVAGRVAGQLHCTRSGGSRTRRHVAGFGITVARDARGIGVGRALLQALETWAREHGVTRVELGVFAGNERAYGLYRSLGYIEEGTERRGARFPEGDVVRMAKLLDEPAPTTIAPSTTTEGERDA